ncbi:MAG: TIGR00282 family metallophosphoesterase [Planctomycetes bacterium]|nr:TIGR00282 family metallophosphoesterase [Planctomycetota bacterium]MBU1517594.1 TIGR00282 family metallophosphoesterase [Planctomycetota bacterium]
MKLNILCIGDIVGRPGKKIVANNLAAIVKQHDIDCVIANAENSAGGSGLTYQIYDKLLKYGVHLITLGDHVFKKKDIITVLENNDNIARPANLSAHAAGKDFALYKTAKGPVVAIVPLIGRIFMKPADSPYDCIDALLPKLQQQADIVIVEMHAEATSEKVSMGYYLDGRVSCVFGTHTHVVTADEKILPKGTAYITDIGMTGAHHSVLGRRIESVIKNFRTRMPCPFEIATEDLRLNGIVITVDSNTKKTDKISRLEVKDRDSDSIGYDSDDGKPDYNSDFE